MHTLKKIAIALAIISGSSLSTVRAETANLTVNVTATIQPGTCYFDQTALTFHFGTVYPASIANSDPALRPASIEDYDETATAKKSGDMWTRHTACDSGSTKMKFKIDGEGRVAMGADGKDIITLQSTTGKSTPLAEGFGIAVYKVDGNTETPINVGSDTDMGDPGNFTLRARLVPLQNKSAADITGGYIYATAMLNISYE